MKSLLSWERGLKYNVSNSEMNLLVCRSSRGSVDWNYGKAEIAAHEDIVAPLVGAWIEIVVFLENVYYTDVAPLVGAWIEI